MKTIPDARAVARFRSVPGPAALVLALTVACGPLRAGEPAMPAGPAMPAAVGAADAASAASTGLYLEGFGGFSGLIDDGLTLDGESYDARYGSGFLSGAALGYQWTNLSLEVEFFYRSNDVDTVSRGRDRFTDGDYASTNLFLNAQYTFGSLLGGTAVVRPYLGVGAGLMQEIDIDLPAAGAEDLSASWEFGFQALVGVRWEFSPHWALFAEGRYTYGGDPELTSESGPSRTAKADYNGWAALAGVRWTF